MTCTTTLAGGAAPPSKPPTARPPLSGIDPLLTAREAAAFRRQGLSTFWRDVREGRVPAPVRISPKAPRWRLSDLCPANPSGTEPTSHAPKTRSRTT
jgi:predicted DNA-binding transcriptional regulator AlpA